MSHTSTRPKTARPAPACEVISPTPVQRPAAPLPLEPSAGATIRLGTAEPAPHLFGRPDPPLRQRPRSVWRPVSWWTRCRRSAMSSAGPGVACLATHETYPYPLWAGRRIIGARTAGQSAADGRCTPQNFEERSWPVTKGPPCIGTEPTSKLEAGRGHLTQRRSRADPWVREGLARSQDARSR